MAINVNNGYEQFYKGTEPIKNYGSGGNRKNKLVRYEFNTTDEHGNKVMEKMSREETLQAMKDIRSQYGDDVILEFSGDGMAALVESKKSGHGVDLDKVMAGTPEQQIVPDDMITQLEGTYRKVSPNDEAAMHVNWHDTLKEKAPDVCNEFDDLMQRILEHGLNHRDDGEKFGKKFIELVTKAEKAISTYDAKNQGSEDMGIHNGKIIISSESLEYMSHVDERKAAQRAERERLEAENPWSPFDYMGDLSKKEPTQYQVFSKFLHNKGFFNGMDDKQAGKMEDMLKDITSGMDSINRLTDAERSYSALSHEAAKLDLISSVNALNYFADTYVSEDIRDSFKNLIKEYESYNSKIVANHKNSADLYSEAMANIPAPNATNVSADVRQSQERTKAYQQIGRVKHTEQEEKGLKEDYQALFDKLMNKQDSVKNIFDSLQNLLVNYASGGSENNAVLNLLNANNAGSINRMFQYWSVML